MRALAIAAVSSLLLTAILPSALSAQTGTVVGTVTDAQSNAPLAGADLILEGADRTALSRDDGRFVLTLVPLGERVVRVERIGYRPLRKTLSVSQGDTVVIDFALTAEPLSLDEIAVMGATSNRAVGNAVARLKIDEVTDRPATLSDFLQGAAVGVEVTGGSGEAGQGKQIRLRGNGSMVLSNQPLVYIDGVRMMEGAFPSEVFENPGGSLPAGANVTTSPLDMVSVGDIDRIEVVKGPAATTLFGTGSANGVIQIFTKRGVPGPPRWTAEVSQGTGWVRPFGANGVDYLHVEHFMRDAWWGGGYEGGDASHECVTADPRWEGANVSPEGACSWPGSQWFQKYRMAVDGGSGILDYVASAEYQNDTYALPLDQLERYAFRTNLGVALSPRVEARLHAAYSDFWTSNTASGRSIEGILLSTMRQDRNYLGSADPRRIANLLGNRNDQWVDRFTAGLSTTFSQSARASHHATLGFDRSRQNLLSVHGKSGLLAPAATTRDWDRRFWTADYLGSYGFEPARVLRSTLSFGGQLVSDDLGWTVRTGVGFPDSIPTTPEEADTVKTVERAASTTTAGLVGQNVLALLERYYLTTGLRVDRHATQGESFIRVDPRVGFAWVVSDEAFWPASLGALRLRSAWGRSSAAPNPFVLALLFGGGQATPSAVPEPETGSEWEVGLDATVFEGRLSVGFTRYAQTNTNALVPVIVDAQSNPPRRELHNVGKIRNQGIELQIDAAVLTTPRWALDVGLGISTNYSKVLDLGDADEFNRQEFRFVVGQPVPASIGPRVADPDGVNGPWSRDRYLTDTDGDQMFALGPQLPTQYLNPSISVRLPGGIALAARGEYRGGNVRFVSPVPVSRSVSSPLCRPYYVNPGSSLDLRPDTPDLWRERCTPQAAADYWFDGDYFKLRSVVAALPLSFAFPARFDDAMLTVILANAFTWYRDVPWWDLEILGDEGANDDGLSSSDRVPAPTTVTFAMRVRF